LIGGEERFWVGDALRKAGLSLRGSAAESRLVYSGMDSK
jgi:hypothetical protein